MALVPVAGESSFLSSLNVDRKRALSRQRKREELLENMDSGSQILKLHQDLQGLADDLDERVESKLTTNENAFFLAYKSFMYTVQKEFKELKQKADAEETKTRRDAKIQSLEKELDWFMTEALRLDELCKKYKKDLDKWKSKADALEDDRKFLENQIKGAKRNNKSLRVAVEKAQTSAYTALVSSADDSRQLAIRHNDQEEHLAVQKPSELEDGPSPDGLSKELEERYQATVRKLKQQLESEQKLAAKLRAVADRNFAEPSELEAFFVDCVEQVKSEIVDRKQSTAATLSQQKARSRGYPEIPKAVASSISLDDFTVTDRRKVVELLLSSEHVLQFLYDKLFPQEGSSASMM